MPMTSLASVLEALPIAVQHQSAMAAASLILLHFSRLHITLFTRLT